MANAFEETDTPAALNDALIAVAQRIDGSRAAIERDETIDLAGVQGEIAVLCAQAVGRAKGNADPVKPGFVALIAALEALHAAILARHGAIKEELNALSARQRAAAAYHGPNGSGR